ncbi:MAG: ribosome-associated translation inhibitor RaiA [Sphingopyxis sp.]
MEIRVSGHQIETGEALKAHVTDRMNAIADKYFSRTISAHATFGRGPHDSMTCDIVAHVMQGLLLKGRGQAQDAHVSFEQAADRIEKQLRRYMRRLKDKNGNGVGEAASLSEVDLDAGYTVFDAGEGDDEAGDAPAIIAETRVDVPVASVSDAVMMLDLRNTTALLFVNAATTAHNMVYRRGDGTIGWVEPRRS